MKDTTDLLARILIAVMFYYEALDSFFYFDDTKETMMKYGVTWKADMLLSATIFVLVLGATLVIIGYYANFGAFLLLLYLVPTTFIIHTFWSDPPDVRKIQLISFMKNMAISGALLLLISNGAGKYSVKRLIYIMKLPS